METRITATDLARSLSDILNRVRYRSESFVIVRRGEEIATLGPKGLMAGVTIQHLAPQLHDLSPPREDFADDLEAIQASQTKTEAPAGPS